MRGMLPPVIFCHYGDTHYLRHTLDAATRSNPGRRIVLLGDAANAHLARSLPVEHVLFSELEHGSELAEFDRVYRAVQGPRHVPTKGGRDWLNFVFRRWYYVLNWLRHSNATAFWHFDSDTMVVRSLDRLDAGFGDVDCTEQCEGSCINGWVSGPDLVERYVRTINGLFTRHEYLAGQQREFDTLHPHWAFTEMRAWAVFRDEQHVRTIRLMHADIAGVFDDALCHDHGFATENLRHGQPIKQVWLGDRGSFWIRRAADGRMQRLNSLNLSWVPDYLFAQVGRHLASRCDDGEIVAPPATAPTLAAMPVPLSYQAERAGLWLRYTAKRVLRGPIRWP
jgi:hypothetical protein